MASKIYGSILIPNLVLGVPADWFVICSMAGTVPYFFFNQKLIGLLVCAALYAFGYAMTKWYDADFLNILIEKSKYMEGVYKLGLFLNKPKIYHD